MNKVAFITGAGGYIGSETAVTLAKQGIKIAVCDIIPETIEKTVKALPEVTYIFIGIVLVIFVITIMVPMMEVYMGSFLF